MTKNLEPGDHVFSPLVADIFTAMASQSADINQRVRDHDKREIARLTAELSLVRSGIENLVYGKYQPTTHSIERALYPSSSEVQQRIEHGKESS